MNISNGFRKTKSDFSCSFGLSSALIYYKSRSNLKKK